MKRGTRVIWNLLRKQKAKVKYQGTKTESTHKKHNDNIAVKISSRKRQGSRNTLKQKIYKEVENERID